MSDHSSQSPALEARVLWGRVATVVAVVVIAFGAGRCSAGGVPEDEVAELEGQVSALESANEDLRGQVADLDEQLAEATAPTPTPSATEPSAVESTAPESPATTTVEAWTVQSGDTLQAIALEVYGDRAMAQQIADANGIEPGATLQIGQVLTLPPAE